ncbi:cytidine deaminase [Kwoniella shandongensis]|uniref:Cytidine deaminase n=1 Tax=Kwoniella shandongensis TaxID=1734106 RepID=A0A5M6C1C5_9TREE|nr:cytidine deaminase [Kwoniella shandongensis]KAA5528400.1 cytidine deaminase [Kwoniella shandongensis]
MAYPLSAPALDQLFTAAIKYRDRAYAPYSNFRVGAALMTSEGQLIGGCNVENASYGGAICAERTAMVKAVSEGEKSFMAVAVVSDIPTPDCSPCGICRQFLREFLAPETPIYFLGGAYPVGTEIPSFLSDLESEEAKKYVVKSTMAEILPHSFGPESLGLAERKV